MPTPMAVLKAATLLAEGVTQETGMGEVIVVDVGGRRRISLCGLGEPDGSNGGAQRTA